MKRVYAPVWKCRNCDSKDGPHFDRSLCGECGAMHYYCGECGNQDDPCGIEPQAVIPMHAPTTNPAFRND